MIKKKHSETQKALPKMVENLQETRQLGFGYSFLQNFWTFSSYEQRVPLVARLNYFFSMKYCGNISIVCNITKIATFIFVILKSLYFIEYIVSIEKYSLEKYCNVLLQCYNFNRLYSEKYFIYDAIKLCNTLIIIPLLLIASV